MHKDKNKYDNMNGPLDNYAKSDGEGQIPWFHSYVESKKKNPKPKPTNKQENRKTNSQI